MKKNYISFPLKFRFILALVCVVFSIIEGRANHELGGEINVKFINDTAYVKLNFYRVATSAAPNSVMLRVDRTFPFMAPTLFSANKYGSDTIYNFNGLRFESALYSSKIYMPDTGLYRFSYASSGQFTSDIMSGKDVFIYTNIQHYTGVNCSSAILTNLPSYTFPTGVSWQYNVAATSEYDSLVYVIGKPFEGDINNRYAAPTFISGYVPPISGIDTMKINSKTGMINFNFSSTGKYFLSVKVQAYKNGVFVSAVNRVEYILASDFPGLSIQPSFPIPDSTYEGLPVYFVSVAKPNVIDSVRFDGANFNGDRLLARGQIFEPSNGFANLLVNSATANLAVGSLNFIPDISTIGKLIPATIRFKNGRYGFDQTIYTLTRDDRSQFTGGELGLSAANGSLKVQLGIYRTSNMRPTPDTLLVALEELGGATRNVSLNILGRDTLARDPYVLEYVAYEASVSAVNSASYKAVFTGCCRNYLSNNVIAQNYFDLVLEATLDLKNGTNSGISAFNFPAQVLFNINDKHVFNSGFYDIEGDSLNLIVGAPSIGNNSLMSGYSLPASNPNTPFGEIANSKALQWQPTLDGDYLLAVTVEEYRNGVKIGQVSRDISRLVMSTQNSLVFNGATGGSVQNGIRTFNLKPGVPFKLAVDGKNLAAADSTIGLNIGAVSTVLANPNFNASFAVSNTAVGSGKKGEFEWTPQGSDFGTTHLLYLSASNGYHQKSEVVLLRVFDDVGLQEQSKMFFSVFPNPNSGAFKISVTQPGLKDVTIYALSGKVIKTCTLTENESEVAIQNLSKGTYVVELNTFESRTQQLIIIQ